MIHLTEARFLQALLTYRRFGWVLPNGTSQMVTGAEAKKELGNLVNSVINLKHRKSYSSDRRSRDCDQISFHALIKSKVKRGLSLRDALTELLGGGRRYPVYARRLGRKRHMGGVYELALRPRRSPENSPAQ